MSAANQQRAADHAIRARLDDILSRYGGQPVSMDIADALVPVVRELTDAEYARGRAEMAAIVLAFADQLAGPPTIAEHGEIRRQIAAHLRAAVEEPS